MLPAIIFTILTVLLVFVAWCLYRHDPYNNKSISSACVAVACCWAIVAVCMFFSASSTRIYTISDVSSYSVDTTITGSDTTYAIKYVK